MPKEPEGETIPALGSHAYAHELRGMVDRPFCFSERYSDQQGRADRTGAQFEILQFERAFVRRAFKLGVPIFAHAVYRSASEQNSAFVRGVSKAKAGQSPHNFGCAVDLVHGTKAWDLTAKQWAILGHLGKEIAAQAGIKITWGGDWKFYDPAHWELSDWRTRRAALAGHVSP